MAWVSYTPPTPSGRSSRSGRTARSGNWILLNPDKPGKRPSRPVTVNTGSGPSKTGYTPGMTNAQILAEAARQADAQLAVERAGVSRQQAAAAAAAARDENTLQGLGIATGQLVAPIAGQIQAMGKTAADTIAGYGQGYSTELQNKITADQGTNAQTVAAQTGDTAPGALTVDPAAVHDALYALGGAIPATEEMSVATASANAAAGAPEVIAAKTHEEIMQRMAEAAATDATYRQQLLDLDAKRPGLVSDAVDKLNSIEQNNFNEWAKTQDINQNQQQIDLQKRAELANEAALGNKQAQATLNEQDKRAALAVRKAQLRLQNKKQAFAVQQAINKGAHIDASSSKVLGYVVDNNGNPVLDENGQRIPVAGAKGSKSNDSLRAAGKAALSLRGKPIDVASPLPGEGKFIADPTNKKTYGKTEPSVAGRPRTTNDPAKARYSGGYTMQQAINYLATTYGITRAQARKLIASAWGL